jgi:hypothetical protein
MLERLRLIELNVLPSAGPRTAIITIITMATKKRISAYSLGLFLQECTTWRISPFFREFFKKLEVTGVIL